MYTMMQVCRELDLTYQTLKFYCNEGLVPNVKRDKNNRLQACPFCLFSMNMRSGTEKQSLKKRRKPLKINDFRRAYCDIPNIFVASCSSEKQIGSCGEVENAKCSDLYTRKRRQSR